jgi:prophage tail gpP-like protein
VSNFTVKKLDKVKFIPPNDGALLKYVTINGKTPPVSLSIHPLEDLTKEITFEKFISYNFKSSILVPVEAFSCEVYYNKQASLGAQGIRKPREGDIFVLRANNQAVACGIIDQLDMDTEPRSGTKLSISGRNLLGQWEDQDSVSLDSKIIYGNNYTVTQIVTALAQNTRINPARTILHNAPSKGYLAATQPGESKLSSMQRYCESLDIWFWMQGDGSLNVGRPNMYGSSHGTFYCLSTARQSNVLSIRSTRASTQIPNIILPIWNGQESVQALNIPQSALLNHAAGPARLRHFSHRTPKAIVVSTPQGASPQDLAEINALLVAGQNVSETVTKAGASTILQAYAKREIAKANLNELKVQVNLMGHYNDRAEPVVVNQVYQIQYEDDDVDQLMFCYEVEYLMDPKMGPQSKLTFCRQIALVSDVRAL